MVGVLSRSGAIVSQARWRGGRKQATCGAMSWPVLTVIQCKALEGRGSGPPFPPCTPCAGEFRKGRLAYFRKGAAPPPSLLLPLPQATALPPPSLLLLPRHAAATAAAPPCHLLLPPLLQLTVAAVLYSATLLAAAGRCLCHSRRQLQEESIIAAWKESCRRWLQCHRCRWSSRHPGELRVVSTACGVPLPPPPGCCMQYRHRQGSSPSPTATVGDAGGSYCRGFELEGADVRVRTVCVVPLVVSSISCAAAVSSYLAWRKKTGQRLATSSVPRPQGVPLLGSIPFLGPNLQRSFADLAQTYGHVTSIHLGTKLCVVVSSPAAAKEVLKDHDAVFAYRDVSAASKVITYGGLDDVAWNNRPASWRVLRKMSVRGHHLINHLRPGFLAQKPDHTARKNSSSTYGPVHHAQ